MQHSPGWSSLSVMQGSCWMKSERNSLSGEKHMNKEEALQQKTLLEEMEDLLQQYQELTQEMLSELEKRIAPTNESKT